MYRELNLSNDFIFKKFMSNEENCKKLISEILGKEVLKIEYPVVEKSLKENIDSKGVRLYVYFKGDDEIYNLEMQTSDERNLDKRSRYYHSVMDIENMDAGSLYGDLKNTYVIFICTFDPYGEGLYKYTVGKSCKEVPDLDVDDGNHTIILNTKGKKGAISDDLKIFLKAVEGIFDLSNYSAKIKSEIDKIKMHVLWEEEFMFEQLRERELKIKAEKEGMEKGMQEGLEKGMEEGMEKGMEKGIEAGKVEAISLLLKTMSEEELLEKGFEKELIKKAKQL